ANVMDGEPRPRARRHDLLVSIWEKSRAQHRVALGQCTDRGLESSRIDLATLELEICMTADSTQDLIVIATDPVCMLYGSQRERRRRIDCRSLGTRSGRDAIGDPA